MNNEALKRQSPAETFEAMNRDLSRKIMTQEYLTSFMARVNQNYEFTYCNAAHPKPIYYKAATDSVLLHRKLSRAELIKRLLDEFTKFKSAAEVKDDITILLLELEA